MSSVIKPSYHVVLQVTKCRNWGVAASPADISACMEGFSIWMLCCHTWTAQPLFLRQMDPVWGRWDGCRHCWVRSSKGEASYQKTPKTKPKSAALLLLSGVPISHPRVPPAQVIQTHPAIGVPQHQPQLKKAKSERQTDKSDVTRAEGEEHSPPL